MAEIKSSGSKRNFNTGAQRDASVNKGRMDLVPLEIAAMLLDGDKTLFEIAYFINDGNKEHLLEAIKNSLEYIPQYENNIETLILGVSLHYENGAKVYGENNWKFGMPLHVYIDSGTRHYLKARRGDTDEDHHWAFVWNFMCAYWQLENGYEDLIDMEFPPVPKTA